MFAGFQNQAPLSTMVCRNIFWKIPISFIHFLLSGQSRDKASLNNYKCILFCLPRKKTLYYFRLKAETLPDTRSERLHVVLVITPGCKKGSGNRVLHGNIYSSRTQRLFSSIQGGQRLITSERRSVVLAPFVSTKVKPIYFWFSIHATILPRSSV